MGAVHFWGRGFKDALSKVVGQKIGNSKTSSKEDLMKHIAEGDIPNRLKLLAFFCRQPCNVLLKAKSHCTLLEIDYAKEDELLSKRLQGHEFEMAREMYLSFVQRLRRRKVWAALPTYVGTGISDLQVVDELEQIRAVPEHVASAKRKSCADGSILCTPVTKRSRMDNASSDVSTVAESGSSDSEVSLNSEVAVRT